MNPTLGAALGLVLIGAALILLILVATGDLACWWSEHSPRRTVPGGYCCSRCGAPAEDMEELGYTGSYLSPGERRTWAREGRQMQGVGR